MKKRLDKKIHKSWLELGIIDASLNPYWREKLFSAKENKVFPIDKNHLEGIPSSAAEAIKKYDLQYCVAKVPAKTEVQWLSEGGMIIFKFWAKNYPTVTISSGNNPHII